MHINKFRKLGYSTKEWNNELSEEKKMKLLMDNGDLYNPFDLPPDVPMANPFSWELIGKWESGEHILFHIMGGHIWKKAFVFNNEVVKAYNYNSSSDTWKEIPKPWGSGEGQNC